MPNYVKCVAIMQPTFLPWVGYFDLIDQVDDFVFLDNVQFEKQSWQQRNHILGNKGLEWITVPVFTNGRFGQRIFDVEIKTTNFPIKLLKTIEHNYARAPYFSNYWDEFKSIILSVNESRSLAQLNISLIRWLSACFNIKGCFSISSEMCSEDGRSERLVRIIKTLGAARYISPIGAAAYLQHVHNYFLDAGIDIVFQNYFPQRYRQLQPGFTPKACALDILFNEGVNAGPIILAGRQRPLSFNEVCHD